MSRVAIFFILTKLFMTKFKGITDTVYDFLFRKHGIIITHSNPVSHLLTTLTSKLFERKKVGAGRENLVLPSFQI